MSNRDYRLDTIKSIMILGIVVEHSLLIYGYPRNHELFWGVFISWLMPMFTLISGYLYKKRSLKDLTSKYLYPMVLFSAVNFAIGYLFYDGYHGRINIVGYAMWYLWALFWFQIITPPPDGNSQLSDAYISLFGSCSSLFLIAFVWNVSNDWE